jgi:endonuclease/exonuclease/phosphatase family metal-dependent hydrolase
MALPGGESATRVRVVSYNVLSPQLCSAGYFPHCTGEGATDNDKRLRRVLSKLVGEVERDAVVCLQEVSRSWEGELHAFFLSRGYAFICSGYGNAFNGYMGVGIAFPQRTFALEGCSIVRVSDTKEGGWRAPGESRAERLAAAERAAAAAAAEGALVRLARPAVAWLSGLWAAVYATALRTLRAPASEPTFDPWQYSEQRTNTCVQLRLRPRPSSPSADDVSWPALSVATYHMPCAFRTPQVMAIHCSLVARAAIKQAKGDPLVLAGDFNVKPHDPAYELLCRGEFQSDAAREQCMPAKPCYPEDKFKLETGSAQALTSAYSKVHGAEPDFTNLAWTKDMPQHFCETLDYLFFRQGERALIEPVKTDQLPNRSEYLAKGIHSLPSPEEPSDHIAIAADFELRPKPKRDKKA